MKKSKQTPEKQFIWKVSGRSESGDTFGPRTYYSAPSPEDLKKLALWWDGVPELDGPADFGSNVYLTVTKVEVENVSNN